MSGERPADRSLPQMAQDDALAYEVRESMRRLNAALHAAHMAGLTVSADGVTLVSAMESVTSLKITREIKL